MAASVPHLLHPAGCPRDPSSSGSKNAVEGQSQSAGQGPLGGRGASEDSRRPSAPHAPLAAPHTAAVALLGKGSLTPPRRVRTPKPPCCPRPRAADSAARRAKSCAGRAGPGAAAAAAAGAVRPAAGATAGDPHGAAPPRAPQPSDAWASGEPGSEWRRALPRHSTRPRPSPHRHLVRRFWNQVLTCASVMRRALASAALSAEARYFWRRKRRSSSSTCEREKEVRGFLRFGGVRFW